MASNSVFFTSPDADFSGLAGAIYHQTFFPTYAGSLYSLYMFGSGFPMPETYDYSRAGRTLSVTGTPALSAGHADVSATVGYTTPFTCIDFASNGTLPVSIIAIGHNPLSTATATATVAGNVVTALTITAPGSGYNSVVPTVSFSGGGGSGAAATAVISGGQVTGLTITNAGTGYTSAPTVTIAAPSGNCILVNSYGAASTVNMMGVALRNTNDSRYEDAIHHTAGTGRNIGFASAWSPAYTDFRAAAFVTDLEEDLCMRWHPGVSAAATSPNTAQSTIANGGATFSIGIRNGGSTAQTIFGDNVCQVRAVAFYRKKLSLAEFEDACEQFETRYAEVVGSW